MDRRIVIVGAAVVLVAAGCLSWRAWNNHKQFDTKVAERMTADGSAARPAAEDWPQWRGPRGDGVSREVVADGLPAGGPKMLWAADVGLGYASPVAAGGRVFLFTLNNKKEALTAFDAFSGHILWTDEQETGWTGDYAGTRATPAVGGDAVYTYGGGAVYTYGGGGDLVCRDVQTGKPRWRVNVLQLTVSGNLGWGVSSSPLVANGLVYVQSGTGGPVAVAVRADSGQVAWQSEARGKGGYAQPVLADVAGTPQLIVFTGETIVGMDPGSGRTIWSQPWSTSYDVNASTPVYADGHLFVTSSYGHGCMMLRVTPTGAEKAWANKEVKSKFQQTILDGGVLYANSDGILKCLSWPDGAVRWKGGDEVPLGENGSIVRAAGDTLVALSDEGEVTLVRATPDGMKKVGQFRAVEGSRVWATPLLYAGRLYVKGPKDLVCFDLSAASPVAGPATGPTTRP